MALTYDLTKCENGMTGLAETLIFATMFVGINHITEKSADEFFVRIKLWEAAGGALRVMGRENGGGFEPCPLTLDEVRAYIGLNTNASVLTKAKFLGNLHRYASDSLRREKAAA